MHDSIPANLTVIFGTRGSSFTVSAACATGALAVGQASQLLRWGVQDVALCGGVQEDTWEYFCQFDALKAFSMRQQEPTRASRPFDRERDGLVPSPGASVLVLEELEHARRRPTRSSAGSESMPTGASTRVLWTRADRFHHKLFSILAIEDCSDWKCLESSAASDSITATRRAYSSNSAPSIRR